MANRANWQTRLRPRPKSDMRFTHREYAAKGDDGSQFRIIIRQSSINQLDFSIILTWLDTDGTEYRLIRFNGKHPSEHNNKWEQHRKVRGSHRFRNKFHIHRATERYQVDGYEIVGFAIITTEYASFDGALALFVRSNGFVVEPDDVNQMRLYP